MFEFLKRFFEEVIKPTLDSEKSQKNEFEGPKTADGIGSVAIGGVVSHVAPPLPSPVAPVAPTGFVDNHKVVAPSPSLPQEAGAITTKVTSPIISILNRSTVVSDNDVKIAMSALQIQLDRDFAPVWGMTASLQFLDRNTPLPVHHWLIVLMDTSDQPGALGYHNLTEANLPIGKVFVADDKKYGLSWTVTLSHELLEMIADPWIANCAFAQTSNTEGTLYALEICDPCESDSLGYLINGILVSDWIYPSWFQGFLKPGSTKFDYMGKITQPFQLAPGGYISKFVVGPNGGSGWTQATAETVPSDRLSRKSVNPNSRTMQRQRDLNDVQLTVLKE